MVKLKLWGGGKILKQGYSLQVTIPKPVAEELGLKAGDRVKVEYSKKDKKLVYTAT